MTAYYNEIDPFAAQWLRNLIDAGHIAPGTVDERDIRDVAPVELAEFTQCHFFAGIGVWSHALRRAGWPDDREIWTGSCPCQPFSAAGAGKGFADERHLWPHWHWLIQQRRPAIIVGEQVASKDGLGWLDLVSSDMENTGYAFGASDLCAAGFAGAHIRQRLYFSGVANGCGEGLERRGSPVDYQQPENGQAAICAADGRLANAPDSSELGEKSRSVVGQLSQGARAVQAEHGITSPPMLGRHPADWLYCRDGRWRPVEPGTLPLAHAPASRVGRLRAYGNGLDAETAQGFIESLMECLP